MTDLQMPISERGRRYGYIIWPASLDRQVSELFGPVAEVDMIFNARPCGRRRVDWKWRRISVGRSLTGSIPKGARTYRMRKTDQGSVEVTYA